jgi:nicotinamide-nucleotide amidase
MQMSAWDGWRIAWAGTLLGMATCKLLAEDAVKQLDNRTVDYTIIVTGHELLTGIYPDGHTYFLTRTLRPLGLRCVGSMSVDDQSADIKQALQFASGRSQLVIVTGGLGPTDSDITREVLSEFTGIPLQEHPEVLQRMEQRFSTPREKLRANLHRQTRVPTRGTYLNNSSGSAVGLVFETDTALIVALPGPPRELQPMVRDELVPELARRFGTHPAGCSVTIRFIGIGQSLIDQTMKEHMHLLDDVLETSQFEAGRVDFTFALPNDRPEDRARLEGLRKEFHEHLGEFIYADDATTTLEDSVSAQLLSVGRTITVAEIGSGGDLAAALCHTELASKVLGGAFAATSEQQLRQLLGVTDELWNGTADSAKLELLATTASRRTNSPWSLVVGPPRQDPQTGAARVAVCIRHPDGTTTVSSQRWPGVSRTAQAQMTSELLDKLRRAIR